MNFPLNSTFQNVSLSVHFSFVEFYVVIIAVEILLIILDSTTFNLL